VIALAGKRVLVTGAGGFVGPHLARALAAQGASVDGTGLGAPPANAPLEHWSEADLADEGAAAEVLAASRPDAIVHLAGQSSAAHSFEAPEETYRANVEATRRLLEAVREVAPRARIITVSTSEIYGPCEPGTLAGEDSPIRPVSPYGRSKADADALAESFAREHGLDVVRARPFGHAGPGQSPRFAIAAWAQEIARIEAGLAEPVLHVGNLEVTRDLSDVRDVVLGYAALLERGQGGRAYNLCRGEGVRLADVVRRMAALAHVEVRIEIDPKRMRPADLPYLVGDPARTASECGWRASTPFENTLADVLADWRARVSEQRN
jgi:GDP-4-dehydro-6-deoxy-D-mannose reductase